MSQQQYSGGTKASTNVASTEISIHEEATRKKKDVNDCVRFYERETGIWEVHGEEVSKRVAEILFRTGDLQTCSVNNAPYLTIPLPQAAAAMAEFLQSQRVEAWTLGRESQAIRRQLRLLWTASPGNLRSPVQTACAPL
jgi:hypothetical protein